MLLTKEKAQKLAEELGNLMSDQGGGLGWYVGQRELLRRHRLTTAQLQQVIDEYEGGQ